MAAIAVIPARYASTRLPRKMLLDSTGKPLVVHVVERARQARRLGRVVVATDHDEIYRAVRDHGHEVVMTSDRHPNGTSRIEEAVRLLGDTVPLIVNVQGDEPLIDPAVIDELVDRLDRGDEPMATVASPFQPGEDPADPNVVKVVVDQRGRAMYFSRSRVPFDRDGEGRVQPLKHIGLYAYRRDFLPVYTALAPTPCEEAEKLEQLRVLEHGHAIAVIQRQVNHQGIDTPGQYEDFVRKYALGTGS